MRFQLFEYLPWLVRYYLFGSPRPRPELYENMIWGPAEGEDLSSFRAADFVGRDSEPSVPEPVELGQGRSFDLPYIEELPITGRDRASKPAAGQGDDSGMNATNNRGPVSVRY